jgi:hypothetical protein
VTQHVRMRPRQISPGHLSFMGMTWPRS